MLAGAILLVNAYRGASEQQYWPSVQVSRTIKQVHCISSAALTRETIMGKLEPNS